ncbi:hypothetical protein MNBD_GAMMA10-2341 [hydrothermal vent metagenome]|uniref:Transposase IS200-like domain-containing protein n=1 Tax=hydrothermal vent metagenome TaxID=652676 RepID=A0A3B0XRX8_9ZZZZ
MARPLRIEYAGALYHVTSRGDRREDIFHGDEDRLIWLDVFSQVCSRFNWRCHAWCLMDNHYHILIETAESNLSQGMRQLNGVYTQKTNRKYKRAGHVFQGRYKAILVQKDEYLLELSRYVVLNPVRAGMVKEVQEWPWSSYGAMTGESPVPDWLETDWLLACFGKQRKRTIARYIDFVRTGAGLPSVWEGLKYQMYLGNDKFVESMQHKLDDSKKESLSEISRLQRRPLARSLQWYEESTVERKKAMTLAYVSGEYTMKEIAEWFGVHYSTVSRAVKLFEENA